MSKLDRPPVGKDGSMNGMTEFDLAVRWIAFACRVPVTQVKGMLFNDQVPFDRKVVRLGNMLSENKLLNPPDPEAKTGQFFCQCGCGQKFFSTYRTKHPKYVNDTHKMRAYRSRKSGE